MSITKMIPTLPWRSVSSGPAVMTGGCGGDMTRTSA